MPARAGAGALPAPRCGLVGALARGRADPWATCDVRGARARRRTGRGRARQGLTGASRPRIEGPRPRSRSRTGQALQSSLRACRCGHSLVIAPTAARFGGLHVRPSPTGRRPTSAARLRRPPRPTDPRGRRPGASVSGFSCPRPRGPRTQPSRAPPGRRPPRRALASRSRGACGQGAEAGEPGPRGRRRRWQSRSRSHRGMCRPQRPQRPRSDPGSRTDRLRRSARVRRVRLSSGVASAPAHPGPSAVPRGQPNGAATALEDAAWTTDALAGTRQRPGPASARMPSGVRRSANSRHCPPAGTAYP